MASPLRIKITQYSHHFVVSDFTTEGKAFILRYALLYGDYNTIRRWDGSFDRKLIRLYAASTKDRREFRFHINTLEEFREFAANNNCPRECHEMVQVPLYTPVPVVFRDTGAKIPRTEDQVPCIEHLCTPGNTKLVTLQTGRGKAQPLNAKIKVPGGWATMGDMAVGDTITARDGSPCKVIGVYPQPIQQIYTITFADGRTAECTGEHLWRVYRPNRVWINKVVDTHEVIRLLSLSNNRLYIDLPEPEDGPDIEYPLDPYLLGVLLGDGCFRNDSYTLSNPEDFIIDEVKRLLPAGVELRQQGDTIDWRISNTSGHRVNVVKKIIHGLGLADKYSYEKHIPDEYLHGSLRQRLALIQGLIDTDGTVGDDGTVSFLSTSRSLAESVQYLIRSVGGIAKISEKRKWFTYKGEYKPGRLAFQVNIRHKRPSELLRLPRKKERTNDHHQYAATLKLSVVKVEATSMQTAQCIAIDHPDHLYITDGFTVTHNTSVFLLALVKLGVRVVLQIRPGFIKRWLDDLIGKGQTIDLKKRDIIVVQGSRDFRTLIALAQEGSLDAKFIIISNKTMQNYISHYEDFNGDVSMYGGVAPHNFYELLGAGIRGIDEVHLDFHFNFKQDLYSNIPLTISLSATLESKNKIMSKMYYVMFPLATRTRKFAYVKYTAVKALCYASRDPSKLKWLQRSMGTYNHIVFEQSIMKNKSMTANYMAMIANTADELYFKVYRPHQKLLVFAATVEMCGLITEALKRRFPGMIVSRYADKDKYESLMESDIVVATLLKAGTAVDVPGLVTVLSTTSVDSLQSNLQALGRLRDVAKIWPDVVPVFAYLVCMDVEPQIRYHNSKLECFKGKVVSHAIEHIDMKL